MQSSSLRMKSYIHIYGYDKPNISIYIECSTKTNYVYRDSFYSYSTGQGLSESQGSVWPMFPSSG